MYWNVRGDIDKCMASYEETQALDDVHIFAFGETHFTTASQAAFRFSRPGYTTAFASRPDGNGGVAVCIHESLHASVLHTCIDPDGVFVSVGEHEVLLVMLYAKPARPGEQEVLFEILGREIARLPQHECALIIGDMNARVADRNRTMLQQLDTRPGGHTARTAGAYGAAVRPRTSMDSRLCGRGRKCIEFCNTHQFDIANGCAPGTGNNAFTFHSLGGLGRSVVDLCLISAHAFDRLLDLSIPDHIPDRCTDHTHITATVCTTHTRREHRRKRPPRLLWKASEWNKYALEVRAQEERVAEFTHKVPHAVDSGEMDELVRSMLRFLASVTITVFGQVHTPAADKGLVWFDDDCKLARNAVRQEYARCASTDGFPRMSAYLRQLTNRYHALMKAKRGEARAREAAELVRNARSDPAMFWRWLHDRKHAHVPIAIDVMHAHFCKVLEADSISTLGRGGQIHSRELHTARAGDGNREGMGNHHLGGTSQHTELGNSQHGGQGALGFQISQGEVEAALMRLRNGRTSGDGYIGELLKYAKIYDQDRSAYVYDLSAWCAAVLDRIFRGQIGMCHSMCMSKLAVIYKGKGDAQTCDSYRGIAIGTAMYKLYATVLHTRLDMYCESRQLRASSQCGFRRRHSTTTALFVLQHAIHSQCTHRVGHTAQPLYVCFVDFKKAFDRVHRPQLWKRLQQLGITGRMLDALQHIYQHTEIKLALNGQTHTHSMITSKGVKQGCPLSPLLFGLFIEQLHELLESSCGHLAGIRMGAYNLLDIFYADDVAMLATVLQSLNMMCGKLEHFCDEKHMEVNVPKSKYVVFRPPRTLDTWPRGVVYKGQELEELQCFHYMGLPVHSQKWFKGCLQHTTTNAARAMWALVSKMHKSEAMPLHIKTQLFDSLVGSVASYGCQVWGVYYLDWRSDHCIFGKNPYQKLVLQFLRIITGAHTRTSRWVLLREFNRLPVQVEWATRCVKWWNHALTKGSQDMAGVTMKQDIALFKEGCNHCWSAMFLKAMAMLGMCSPVEVLKQLDVDAIAGMRISVMEVEQAYMSKYDTLYWDTHGTDPRARGGGMQPSSNTTVGSTQTRILC